MYKPFYVFFQVLLLVTGSCAQSLSRFVSNKDIFGTRVFIENKGQFDKSINTPQKVLYAYENGEERIYFTNEGIVHKFIKTYPLTEEQREAIEKGKKAVKKADQLYYVHVKWANANKQLQVIASEKQSWYFTYGSPQLNSYGYKKITYKNVYDHIDIEYIIPEDKEYGIKYNIILHPSADPDAIKILYSGDVKKISKKGKEIIVKTPMSSITEHAPESFDENKIPVATSYVLRNDTIKFHIDGSYDQAKELVIDPWITVLSSLTNANYGYDVDYDNAGNLYVYGGGSPNTAATCKLSKYSPTGVLLWTFPTILTPQGWNTSGLSGIPGNFTVNKITQKSYTGETFGSKIIRLDANGNYDNFITAASNLWEEIWEFAFNPCTQTVYGFGGGISFNRHAAIVDEVNATSVPLNLSGFVQTNQDVICSTIDDNGDLFMAFTVPAPNFLTTPNHILKINTAFTGNSWVQPTSYTTFLEYSNKPYFSNVAQSITSPSSNGFNCIAVNANNLYYYDGFNVAVFNKLTGLQTASTNIPGYSPLGQGGIAVDDCDNIYLGGDSVINVLHFNGTAFSILPTIPLGANGPVKRVYDLRLDRTTHILYACGSKFVATYNATQICNNTTQIALSANCGFNNNATAVASVTPAIPGSSLSYTWTGASGIISQVANSTQTSNAVSNLANGNYTLYVQANAPCGVIYSQTLNINCPLCSVTAGGTVNCIASGLEFLLSATNPINFNSGLIYNWAGPGSYSSILSHPSFTNGITGVYTLTATDGSCTATAFATLSAPPALTLSATANPSTGCVGKSISLNVTGSGGAAPYTYNWTGGSSGSVYIVNSSNTGAYTYSVSGIDAKQCKASTTVSALFNAIPFVSANNVFTCEGTLTELKAAGAESYTWFPGSITGNPYAITVRTNGSFTVIGSTQGCTNSAVSSISMMPAPTATLSAFSKSGCEPLCVNLSQTSANSLSSYNWLINGVSIGTLSSIGNYCFRTAGNYLVSFIGKDANGCKNLPVEGNVSVYKKPTANFTFKGEFTLPEAEVFYTDESSSNVTNWHWYFGDSDSSNIQNPRHIFYDPKIYRTFLVVETYQGCKDTIGNSVKINALPLLFIPNSFTPNGDGKNDTFFAKGEGIRNFKMSIYDRWGEKLFETHDITKAWDGTYKGKIVQEGTYAWLIIYTLETYRTETVGGHVNVLK